MTPSTYFALINTIDRLLNIIDEHPKIVDRYSSSSYNFKKAQAEAKRRKEFALKVGKPRYGLNMGALKRFV